MKAHPHLNGLSLDTRVLEILKHGPLTEAQIDARIGLARQGSRAALRVLLSTGAGAAGAVRGASDAEAIPAGGVVRGEELIQRRVEDRCIRCGSRDVRPDPETGFVERLCETCDRDTAAEHRGGATAAIERAGLAADR